MITETLSAVLLLQASPALENEYVRVSRDSAPCAAAPAACGDRVIVALGPLKLGTRTMARGDVAVFVAGEKHAVPAGGSYFEVAIKPVHPPVLQPDTIIPPTGNVVRYDGAHFRIFEERLAVGEFRPRHSHPQRVVIQLNRTRLKQIVDGQKEPVIRDIEPDRPTFNAPVVHTSETVGDKPLRGIVIELKPR
jgi:hypothetical protein